MNTYKELVSHVQQIFANENFTGDPSNLFAPIDYTLALGGKRLRPLMLLAATDLFGGDIRSAHHAAIAVEVFHNFTLLHDDLMDRSPLRRGQPTVYCKWNENTAILSGDAMTALAWRHLLATPNATPRLYETFNEMCMDIYRGQQYDMDFEQRNDVSIPEYMEMIRLKTAVLIAGALRMGAICANANPDDEERLYHFGNAIGLAFQLRDDLLDAYGDTATLGKQTGSDIRDNKKTFLFLHALEKGNTQQQQRLLALFNTTPDDPTDKINEVIDIYNHLDIRNDVDALIADYHNKALTALDAICRPENDKTTLLQIANSLLNRDK